MCGNCGGKVTGEGSRSQCEGCGMKWDTSDFGIHCTRRRAANAPVVTDVQPIRDAHAPEGQSWLVEVRAGARQHTLLISGAGVPLHHNGAYLTRAPAGVERAAFRMVFGRGRGDELLALLSGDVAPVAPSVSGP